MQVVQRMTEQLPTSSPVRLLHHTCQQVQAQAQTGSGGYMSEGYSQGSQDVFASRGMASEHEDPFARASSSMPLPPFANAQMFRGVPLHCLVVCHPALDARLQPVKLKRCPSCHVWTLHEVPTV